MHFVSLSAHLTFGFGCNSLTELPEDAEFLEAITSALRALLQTMASKNISQVRGIKLKCSSRFTDLTGMLCCINR